MKNDWMKHFGLSLFLSCGLFFLNGKTVHAEERDWWGPPRQQHEFSDDSDRESSDRFFHHSWFYQNQESSGIQEEEHPANEEPWQSFETHHFWKPEVSESEGAGDSQWSEPFPADAAPVITEQENITELSDQTDHAVQNLTESEPVENAEDPAMKSPKHITTDRFITTSAVFGDEEKLTEPEGDAGRDFRGFAGGVQTQHHELTVFTDAAEQRFADRKPLESFAEMKGFGKSSNSFFTPAADRSVMTPAAAEDVKREEENSKPAWNKAENRFGYTGKSFPAMMGDSSRAVYRNTDTPFRGGWASGTNSNRFAGYRETRHFFSFEKPAELTQVQPSSLTAAKADLTDSASPSDSLSLIRPELTAPAEFIISGTDIPVINGVYSFKLVLRSNRTLTFDNDLENTYQGIDGAYQMHYDINEEDNHTMIVDGLFTSIITASPLLDRLPEKIGEWVSEHISEDSYLYQLALVTQEGFTFENALKFLYDKEREAGISVKYAYDLLTDKFTWSVDIDPIWSKIKLQLGFDA